jgi:integrase/recombinase XerD
MSMAAITSILRRHGDGRAYDRCGYRESTCLNPQNFAITIGKPLAPQSLAGYQQDLMAYRRFCGHPDAALEASSLARWRVHLAQDALLSPNTINRRLAAVKRVVREAAAQGYVDSDTAEAFRRVRGLQVKALKDRLKIPSRLPPAQIRILCDRPELATLKGWRDRALLHTLASSGCRVSEIVTLTTAQIRTEAGSFFLEVLGKNQTKPELAPLSHEAYRLIEAWVARRPVASPYVFTSFGGRGRQPTPRLLDRSAAFRLVQHYARLVGLGPLSPHDLRRFVGTQLAKRDIRQAQKVLRHKDISTTARHYVLDELAGGLTDGLY